MLFVALMLAEVPGNERAVRDDPLPRCHNVVQGKVGEDLSQSFTLEFLGRFRVAEVHVSGPVVKKDWTAIFPPTLSS